MKIIHTIKNINNNWIYDIDNLRSLVLSCLLAKKHYDDVVLYTDKIGFDLVKKLKLPYTEVYLDQDIDTFNGRTFSIPKLITFSKQTEPFLHIDHDTFLFKPLPELTQKYVFAYPDLQLGVKPTHILNDVMLHSFVNMFNTYIKTFSEHPTLLNNDFIKNIKLDYIPNMCIFGGVSVNEISSASSRILDIYDTFSDIWDLDYYNACIVEQLFIIPMLKKVDTGLVDFNFLFKNTLNPFICELKRTNPLSIPQDDSNLIYVDGIPLSSIEYGNKVLYKPDTVFDWIHVSYLKKNPIIKKLMINSLSQFYHIPSFEPTLMKLNRFVPELFIFTDTQSNVTLANKPNKVL